MKAIVGLLGRKYAGLVLSACLLLSPGRVFAQGAQQTQPVAKASNLVFSVLASTNDAKDKKAIEAWQEEFAKAKDDMKVAEKIAKAATDNVPPALLAPAAETPAGPKHKFAKMSLEQLAKVEVNPKSEKPEDKDLVDKIKDAQTKWKAIEAGPKNVYLYSWKDAKGESQYAVLMQPAAPEKGSPASTNDPKDKEAIDAWKALFAKAADDEKVKELLAKAAKDNVPPELPAPEEKGDDTAKFTLVKLSTTELALLGINPTPPGTKGKTIAEAVEKARTDKKPFTLPGKDLLLFSWNDPAGKAQYAALARPISDGGKFAEKDLQSVRALPDPENIGYWGVLIALTKDGSKKFKTFSEQNQKHALILQVDDKIVHAVRLGGPIDLEELQITGQLDRQQAEQVRAAIQRCIRKDDPPTAANPGNP